MAVTHPFPLSAEICSNAVLVQRPVFYISEGPTEDLVMSTQKNTVPAGLKLTPYVRYLLIHPMIALAASQFSLSFGESLSALTGALLTLLYAISWSVGSASLILYCFSDTGLGLYPLAGTSGSCDPRSPPRAFPDLLPPLSVVGRIEKTSTTLLDGISGSPIPHRTMSTYSDIE